MNDKDTVARLAAVEKISEWIGFSASGLKCGAGWDGVAEQLREEARAAVKVLAAALSTSVREEVEYEVWQDDAFGDGEAMVAGSTDLADAQHYAAVYSQDAPAWVVEVTRRHLRDDATPTDLPPLQDTGERDGR